SGICACGNYRVIGDEKEDSQFCEQCGVEFVDSRIRRYQMGYIKLTCPVTHVWYLKRLPSYIANLLDKPLKELEGLVYCDVPITKKPTFLRLRGSFEYEIQSWKYSIPLFFTTQGFDIFRNREISTGAGAIREQLADLDLRIIIENSLVEWKQLGEEGPTGNEWEDRKIVRRKDFLVRRMELAKHFIRTNIEPEWMILCLLPVLPPELRPIIQIEGGKLMSSDINELYRRVIYRNNTLTDLLTTSRSTPGELVMCQEKLVQEAVDTLLDNGIRGQPMRDGHNKVYKSFSDVIEGKEGRFRETLLGKRVDYSGRSVIVVGPSLSLHRCGLPREIAIELFQTFVIRGLIRQHLASNIGVAKSQIREKKPIVWEILQEVMQGHPVLLNRAPTLHRLGIQSFQPILVEGRTICLHPLVCKGFNADFDGDQMAVHVPLSLEAQAEARLLMFSHMNLLSPAIGDPISLVIFLFIEKSRKLYKRVRKYIYSDSEGEMHWSTDVSHAPEFTYSNVHLLPKTSHLWILSGGSCGSSLIFSIHKDQDQMNIPFLSVERKSISSLSVNNDQVSKKFFSSDFSDKKKSGIPNYSELNGIVGTSHYNFIYSAIFHENSDLLAKRRRNRFLIPFQSIQEQAKEFIPHSGISIEIPINGIFRRNSIFAFFDDPRYRRKSSGILKYGTLKADSIVQKEDMIEYRGVQKFKTKYEMKVDRFFFIPEEVHILPESSAIMYHWSRYTNHFKYKKPSRRVDPSGEKKKRIELKIFSGDIHFPDKTDKISRHSGILIPPGRGKTNSKESKNLKNWIYAQRITPTKKKFFVLVRPVATYEIMDSINLATLFPQDLFREKDNIQLRVFNYILYGNGKPTRGISDTSIQLVRTCLVLNWDQDNKNSSLEEVRAFVVEVSTKGLIRDFIRIGLVKSHISSAKPYLATPGAKVHGHYREILYEGDTLVTFIYEKSRSGDITQGLPKVEQVLEVRSIDSISLNLEKRIKGWNRCITRILGIPWGFLIGAELTIVQSRISLVNKIQKVYRSQGVQIHNRHIEIIVRQITSKVLVSEEGMSNVFLPGELIGLLRAERTGRALEEAICYRAVLLGITRASLNTQSFISEASFQETARVLAKAALRGRIDWLKGLKENVVLGGVIPAGTGFNKGLVHCSRQHTNILFEKKTKNLSLLEGDMRDILFYHREFCDSSIYKSAFSRIE
ncbi:hypothetical protein HID58_094409, partial [Brassica napus]